MTGTRPRPAQAERLAEQERVLRAQSRKAGLVIGIVALLGLVIAVLAVTAGPASGEEYVEDHYLRAPHLDLRSGSVVVDAYTAGRRPADVAADIARGARPLDHRRTANGEHYLQYKKDIVAVLPHGTGSLVVADDYRDMHLVFRDDVGGWWSATPPGSSHGGGWVGGGSGLGK